MSVTKSTYLDPNEHVHPCFRPTDKDLHGSKLATKTSGYQQNRAFWDGQGWIPEKILHPQNVSSEYRDRFNPEMDFHRKVNKHILPQIKQTEHKYVFNK